MFDENSPIGRTADGAADVTLATAAADAIDVSLESELRAAIEYKIAVAGVDGVRQILDIVNSVVKRNAELETL